MKKYHPAFIVLIPALLIFFAFTQGPPAGNTGSPLDGQNCTNCHGFLPGNLPGWITSNIPVEGYTPEETYTVTVTAIGIVAVKMGFQITSETQVEKAGTFNITDPERTQLKGSTTVTHTSAGTEVTQLPATWSMNWVAPSSGTGDITFYTAVNQTNNDNSSSGDLIFVSSLVVAEAFVGIAEHLNDKVGHIYPNPAQEYIILSLPVHSEVYIIDAMGREVMYFTSNEKQLKIDVSWLNDGIYYAQINNREQTASRSFVKK